MTANDEKVWWSMGGGWWFQFQKCERFLRLSNGLHL